MPDGFPEERESAIIPPLVVDLDGTLIVSDSLLESVLRCVKAKPACLLLFPFWLLQGRARFKEAIAERAALSADKLPYRLEFVDWLKARKAEVDH